MHQTFRASPNFATLERVRVLISDSTGIRVQRLNQSGPSGQINATKLKHIPVPVEGKFGYILYTPMGAESRACWIGEEISLSEQNENEAETAPNPNEISMTNNENTANVNVSPNNIQISNQNSQISSDAESMSLAHGSFQSRLNSSEISFRNEDNTFKLGRASVIQTRSSLDLMANGGFKLSTPGNVIISSGVQYPDQSNQLDKLGPVGSFVLKASDAKIAVGGMTVVNAGAMSVNLASRRLIDSGNRTTFKLNIVQGDGMLTIGSGDLDINTLGITNFASITSGSFSTGFYSRLKTTRLYGEFRNFMSGLVASVSVRRGEVLVEATKAITMESDATFSLTTKGKGDIEVKGKLTLKTNAQMVLESTGLMEFSATMMKLQDARIISLGSPRVATPNPSMSGGWCAIAMCPFAMTPHCGDILTG